MSKIQLIKETNIKGEIVYYVEVDGEYIKDSSCMDFKKALALYDKIKYGLKTSKEIIKSEEI